MSGARAPALQTQAPPPRTQTSSPLESDDILADHAHESRREHAEDESECVVIWTILLPGYFAAISALALSMSRHDKQ